MRRFVAAALGMTALAILAAFGQVGGARANGVPQLVKLTYLNGVSNWGPTDAEGVLEFSFAEAYARVDVKNLRPVEGYTFEGWLTGGGGAPLLVGTIAPGSDGVGVLETKLENLKRYDYDTFTVAGRSASSKADAMPADKSIAGRFTVIQDSNTTKPGDTRPATLPDTGEAAGTTTRERVGRTLIVIGAAAGVAILALRFLRREKAHD
jgi:hypothetical protein